MTWSEDWINKDTGKIPWYTSPVIELKKKKKKKKKRKEKINKWKKNQKIYYANSIYIFFKKL